MCVLLHQFLVPPPVQSMEAPANKKLKMAPLKPKAFA